MLVLFLLTQWVDLGCIEVCSKFIFIENYDQPPVVLEDIIRKGVVLKSTSKLVTSTPYPHLIINMRC